MDFLLRTPKYSLPSLRTPTRDAYIHIHPICRSPNPLMRDSAAIVCKLQARRNVSQSTKNFATFMKPTYFCEIENVM